MGGAPSIEYPTRGEDELYRFPTKSSTNRETSQRSRRLRGWLRPVFASAGSFGWPDTEDVDQCLHFHLEAAFGREAQNCPKRVPRKRRIDAAAGDLRQAEYQSAPTIRILSNEDLYADGA